MPQIWLTYEELGAHFGCSATAARAGVIDARWDRRRSHDGLTRVKLPDATAVEYIRAEAVRLGPATAPASAPATSGITDAQVAALRSLLALAERRDAKAA